MVVAPVVAVACRPTHWQLGRSLVQPGGPGACASHQHVGLVVTSKHTQPPATSMLGAPRLQSYSPLLLRLPLSADANDVASLYFCCEVFGSGGLPTVESWLLFGRLRFALQPLCANYCCTHTR